MEFVTLDTHKKIMESRPKSADFEAAAAAAQAAAAGQAASAVDSAESADETTETAAAVALFPLEAPEAHAKEWINLFCPDSWWRVIDFAIGAGQMALACCRKQLRYRGLAFSEFHKHVVVQILTLKVVRELILQTKDGFGTSRFLSKTRSLNGSEAPPAQPERLLEPASSATATGTQPVKDEPGSDNQQKKKKDGKKSQLYGVFLMRALL